MGATAEDVIRLQVPAQEDYVSLLRATARVVAGRLGCPDDARTRLQAATGIAFFALLEDVAAAGIADPGAVRLQVSWDDDRVTAELSSDGRDDTPALAALAHRDDLADGRELLDDGAGLRLWVGR